MKRLRDLLWLVVMLPVWRYRCGYWEWGAFTAWWYSLDDPQEDAGVR